MKEFILRASVLGWLPEDSIVYMEDYAKTIADLSPREWHVKVREMMSLANQMNESCQEHFQQLVFDSEEISRYYNGHRRELEDVIVAENEKIRNHSR